MLSAHLLAFVLGLPVAAPASAVDAPAAPPSRPWTADWAVSLATGRSFYDSHDDDRDGNPIWAPGNRESEIRVTHQGAPLVFGAALHRVAYPSGRDVYAVGAGLVLGAHHPLRSWLHAELDAALGLERPRVIRAIELDPGGSYIYSEWAALEAYARFGAGLALRITSWLEIPARLTLHTRPLGDNRSLGAASVGLRCLLP